MFGRRTPPESDASGQTPTATASGASVAGKGRPTPTRAEAEAARRQRAAPPRNRKEAAARRKQVERSSRGKMRAAMETGDDRYLPARDKGPVKRYIRDYVDSHRTIGQFLLPIFFVIFVVSYLGATWSPGLGNIAWLVVMVLLALDSVRVMRGVKAGIRSKFGEDATKGITMYALMRSWQMRRLRLPKPLVKPGDPI